MIISTILLLQGFLKFQNCCVGAGIRLSANFMRHASPKALGGASECHPNSEPENLT